MGAVDFQWDFSRCDGNANYVKSSVLPILDLRQIAHCMMSSKVE